LKEAVQDCITNLENLSQACHFGFFSSNQSMATYLVLKSLSKHNIDFLTESQKNAF